MTDKAKASEHDLREGSKLEVNELVRLINEAQERDHSKCACCSCTKVEEVMPCGWGYCWHCLNNRNRHDGCEACAEIVKAFLSQVPAILEENQRLRTYVESLPANWNEDSSLETWFPLTAEVLKRMEAENQSLAKELEDVHKRLLAMVVVLRGKCSDGEWVEMEKTFELKLKEQEAAEAKLGKMREALEALRKDAVVLSREYLNTVARGKSDDDTVQGWDLGRWKRALKAYEQAEAMGETIVPVHPVQTSGHRPGKCPQSVTMRAYEAYCYIFRPQEALITGNCRGGFGTGELIALLYARSFPKEEWDKRFHEALHGAENL